MALNSYTEKKRYPQGLWQTPHVDGCDPICWRFSWIPTGIPAIGTCGRSRFRDIGLHARPSKSVSPLSVFSNAALEYWVNRLGDPAFDVKECVSRGVHLCGSLRVKVRLIRLDRERSNKHQGYQGAGIYSMVKSPLMTENGTFRDSNGTERVIRFPSWPPQPGRFL